jgi:small-conductance mechanosensitive channel/tellurite resistance protein
MEIASNWVQVLGLLAILVGASFVFVRVVNLIVQGRGHGFRFGFELLVFFAIVYFFAGPALGLIALDAFKTDVTKGAAFLWWISLAYTINTGLKRFVWDGTLSVNGKRRIPKLMIDGIALLLYAGGVAIVLHFVYDESVTAILATSGAAAVIVGLSAQSTMKEVFSGIALNTTKALKIGDFVEIDSVYGQVYEINWRSISLLNPHTDSLYIFPNSTVAEKVVLNYCEPTERFKNWIKFTVELSASPDLVISTIAEELEHSRFIFRDPKPDFNILGFNDMGIEFRVRYYFDGDDPWWDAQNEMCMAIWSSLRRKGIHLSIDRHNLRTGDEYDDNPWILEQAAKPRSDPTKLLRRSPLFTSMSAEALSKLVQTALQYDYTPPDCVFRKGGNLTRIYCVKDGVFAALEPQSDGSEAEIERYHSGEFFGLEAISATPEAANHVQCLQYGNLYFFDAAAVKSTLKNNPKCSKALRVHLDRQIETQKSNRKANAKTLAFQEHVKHRTSINLHLREHLDDLFSKPLLHQILHSLSARSKEHDLLESMMAACALVASARGEVDKAELTYLRKHLSDLDIFKHTSADTALGHFEDYARKIAENEEKGTKAARAQVSKVAGEAKLAKIVLATAHGMSGVHTHPLKAEKEMLSQIADTLKISADLPELIQSMKGSSA